MENINQIPNLQPVQPVQPVRNQNIFKYLFIISIIVLLGVIVGFYYVLNNKIAKLSPQQNNNSQSVLTPIPTETISDNAGQNTILDAQQTLNLLKRHLNANTELLENTIYKDWFIKKNNAYIFLTGFSFRLGVLGDNYGLMLQDGMFSSHHITDDNGKTADISFFTEKSPESLQVSINDFFNTNNFKKDIVNTKITSSGTLLGYSRGNLECLISLTPLSYDPFANIFCGIIDQTQIVWRKELEPVINSDNDPNLLIRVNNLVGNYARGDEGILFTPDNPWGEGESGSSWIAQKVDGIWKKIWTNHGGVRISCAVINIYQIPKEIYEPYTFHGECETE